MSISMVGAALRSAVAASSAAGAYRLKHRTYAASLSFRCAFNYQQ